MALVVEDGTGKTDAESYVSVADAITYLTAFGSHATFLAASTADQEKSLRMATQWLDTYFQASWKGCRGSEDQALAWPREGVYDHDAYLVDWNSIPKLLKNATSEMASRFSVAGNADLVKDVGKGAGAVSRKTQRIGPLTQSIAYHGSETLQESYPKVVTMLSGYLQPGDRVVLM